WSYGTPSAAPSTRSRMPTARCSSCATTATSGRARSPTGSAFRSAPSRRARITPCGRSKLLSRSAPSMADHPVPRPDLAGYVLQALEPDASQAFAAHLRDCHVCAEEVAALDHLPALLAEAAPPVEVPVDLEARTFARIEDEARRGTGARDAGRAQTRRVGGSLQRMLAVAAGFLLLAGGVALAADLLSGA